MVLANTKKTMDLLVQLPAEPDPGSFEDDSRINDISLTVLKMEETENTFYSNNYSQDSGANFGPDGSDLGTPRSSRPCSIRNNNRTLLNSAVTLNSKNSAMSKTYTSPRQFTLASSRGYRSASGLVQSLKQEQQQNSKPRHLASISASSFDYDANEAIPLEYVRTYRPPKVRVYETKDFYTRACSYLGITASQTYVKQVSSGREICMANTSLSHVTVKPIAISLVRDYRITILDLSGNDLGSLGVIYIAEMLAVNDTIYEVNLSNTSPGRKGLQHLADRLKENKTVNVLKLESNSLDHTETEELVRIIRNAPNVKELYLGHNNLGYDGAKLLAEELEVNTSLLTLDLQWNHFRKQSASQLCKAIKANKGLHRLNLAWNGLGKEGCIALARALPHNTTLRSLDLTNNRIDVVSLPFLLHGLVRNKNLEFLQLAKNPMTTEGVKAVIRAITGASNVAIKYLNIEDIPVDKEFTSLVKKLKEQRNINVDHGVEMYSAIELTMKEHDPHDLNRFDPVMVIVEYMRIDNLRLIDLFGYFDTSGKGLVSRSDLRAGVATLGLPLTEYHLDCIMHDIDSKKDGYIDLEEFMAAHRDMSKVIIQRTTKAKLKGKEDQGLKELRKILKELVEKRNKRNKEKAQNKMNAVWTGAINKVKAMDKEKTDVNVTDVSSDFVLPPLKREVTFQMERIEEGMLRARTKLVESGRWDMVRTIDQQLATLAVALPSGCEPEESNENDSYDYDDDYDYEDDDDDDDNDDEDEDEDDDEDNLKTQRTKRSTLLMESLREDDET